MPRNTFDPGPKPFAGLTARRKAKGLPTGPMAYPAPLEWWQLIELQTVRDLADARSRGVLV
jgi:hypothetical protein